MLGGFMLADGMHHMQDDAYRDGYMDSQQNDMGGGGGYDDMGGGGYDDMGGGDMDGGGDF